MNNAETVRAFFAAYSDHNTEAMLELCSPTAMIRLVPLGDEGKVSVKQAAQSWQLHTQAFPDFKIDLQQLIEAKGAIVAETLQGGTQASEVGDIKNQGRRTWASHFYIFEFDEGQIAHITCIWDFNTVYQQLGHTETHS